MQHVQATFFQDVFKGGQPGVLRHPPVGQWMVVEQYQSCANQASPERFWNQIEDEPLCGWFATVEALDRLLVLLQHVRWLLAQVVPGNGDVLLLIG